MTLEYRRDQYGSLKLRNLLISSGHVHERDHETWRGGDSGIDPEVTEIRTEIDEIWEVGRGRSEVGSVGGRGRVEVAHLAGSRHLGRRSDRGAVLQYAH